MARSPTSARSGKADVERGTPLATDTIFRIYSMTKAITSVAFMMLVEEGRVALEDPVEAFIPAWKDLGVFAAGIPPQCLTDADRAADADGRPAAPYLRPDLRLPEPDQCRRRLSQGGHRRGRDPRDAGGVHREAGPAAAGVLAGRGVELFGVHRRARLSGGDHLRACRSTSFCARASSSRWAWSTPASTCRRRRPPASPPATTAAPTARWPCRTTPPPAPISRRPPSTPAAAAWSPQRRTI